MVDGYVRIANLVNDVRVADVDYNAKNIISMIRKAYEEGARVINFPALSLTGITIGDLVWQQSLLEKCKEALKTISDETKDIYAVYTVGMPYVVDELLYNVVVVMNAGDVLAIVPQSSALDKADENLGRYFAIYTGENIEKNSPVDEDEICIFGNEVIVSTEDMKELRLGYVVGEDYLDMDSLSTSLVLEGATIINCIGTRCNLIGRDKLNENYLSATSHRDLCVYSYVTPGLGESSTNVSYKGSTYVYELGGCVKEEKGIEGQISIADVDVRRVLNYRHKKIQSTTSEYDYVLAEIDTLILDLTRHIPKSHFIPEDEEELNNRCAMAIDIASDGLVTRLKAINQDKVVLGLSGGLDSTLALLVCIEAMKKMKKKNSNIFAITMPGMGTSDRTYDNACSLAKETKCTLREISIKNAVTGHFKDINKDPKVKDVTYENAQARERAQILMDVANMEGALQIGTGDMSELALGWCTYGGDQMCMYGVNGSIPKTMMQKIVTYYANNTTKKVGKILMDIVDTPISPELIPGTKGVIRQKTEDIVGPYELHDFYLYYVLHENFTPGKILRLAEIAFKDEYDRQTLKKWLKNFYKRFITQQFKRSCMADGVKIGTMSLSPRGDLNMPSDASISLYMDEIDNL